LRLLDRLRALTGSLIKPIQAGWRRLPRLWAFITGKKAGGLSLYRQDFSGLDLGDLLCAVNRELPGSRKGNAGKAGKKGRAARKGKAGKRGKGGKAVVKRVYCPPPGTVRVSGSFLWAGKSREI
jgi:hypothetical protein